MYDAATIKRKEENRDGRVEIFVAFTGSGEPERVESVFIDWSRPDPLIDLRKWAKGRIDTMNGNKVFSGQVDPFLGQPLDLTTPFPAEVPAYCCYMAASAPFVIGTAPTDIFTITGSATKLATLMRMSISTVQTSAGMNAFSLLKRSTANTGGTADLIAAVPTEKSYPAATAVVRQYRANPATLGTNVGALWSGRVPSPAPAD